MRIYCSSYYINDFKIFKNNDPKFNVCPFLSLGLTQVVKEMHVNKERVCITVAGCSILSVINSLDLTVYIYSSTPTVSNFVFISYHIILIIYLVGNVAVETDSMLS